MASVKLAYGTAVTGTGGINSLASSATWVAGYEWFVLDNSSDLWEDWFVDLVIRVGTTPTVNTEIRVYLLASYDGSTYPDVFDGTGSAETVTSAGVRDSFAKLAGVGVVDSTTSDRDYPIQFNVSSFYPNLPKKVIIFVAHNTGVNLNATAGNQKYAASPIYRTVA
jgi:hypothetical protein